jgi:hypothetical protein
MNKNIAVGLLMLCSAGAQAGLLSILDVSTVKESELEMCPNITVEQMVDSFFEDPEWSGGKAADGRKLVNVSGTIKYDNQPARAMVQIWMQGDDFSVEALEINGRPQPDGMLDALLAKMCQSAKGSDNAGNSGQQVEGLPFTGTKFFNFMGGSGTQQSITIDPNGHVTLRSHGAASAGGNVSVDYEGIYEEPLLTPAGNYRVHADKIYVTDEAGDLPDPSECQEVACETELYAQ